MEIYIHTEFIFKVTRQGIGRVYTPVLAAGTTKVHHQAFKPTVYIIFHRNINQVENTVQIFRHFGLLFQEILYAFVPARLVF